MKYAILPCNGLDKSAGPVAREAALWLVSHADGKLICPVLLNNSPDRYARVLGELPLLVIDGCATQCATKLANRLGMKIARKLQVAEEAERLGATLGKSLTLGQDELRLAGEIAATVVEGVLEQPTSTGGTQGDFVPPQGHIEVAQDKFLFKIPSTGFFFNENDVWAQVDAGGGRARIGVSDFAQQQLTDISFVGLPAVGAEVDQFGEVGYVESAKATLELVSPVSGRVVAVNSALSDAPETINQDAYGKGWIAELELRDFSADRELLIDGSAYAEIITKKAGEYA
ncbi:MAG: glycine cleavage system protein GcvH [Thermoguttaceae bacterium]